MLLRSLLTLLSPGGCRGRLSILIYHRVLPEPDPLLPGEPDRVSFRWQMELLARHFNPLPLAEAVQRLRAGTLPPRAACVTFDDGYADNAEEALPVLQSVGVPATFFIAAGYLNGGRMFNDTLIETVRRLPAGGVDLTTEGLGQWRIASDADRVALFMALIGKFRYCERNARNREVEALPERLGISLPRDLMMRDYQVRQLADAGMEVGGHTLTHPILAEQSPDEARREIRDGREALEGIVDRPVRLFAYPNGRPGQDYAPEHVDMVRDCAFDAAVSTAPGAAGPGADPFQLPRFTPWDQTPTRFGLRLARNLGGRA